MSDLEESAEEVSTEETVEAESHVVEGMEQEYTSIDDLRNIGEEPDEAESEVIEAQDDQSDPEPEAQDEKVDEWEPNYTYKVKDEVLEFNEAVREAIKDKDVEDHIRDLYTRSAGLDSYKAKNGELEQKLGDMTPQLAQLVDGYKNIKHLKEVKDFDRLTEILGWGEEDLLDYAEKILERQDLPEEQRNAIVEKRKLEDRVNLMENQLETYGQKTREEVIAEETALMDSMLSSDAYAEGVRLLNEVGLDLKQEALNLGISEFQASDRKKYPDMADVVSRAYEKRKALIERLGHKVIGTENENESVTEEVETVRVVEKQPTLPKINGTNNNKIEETMTFEKLQELAAQIPTR